MKALDEYFLMVVFTLLLNRLEFMLLSTLCLIWIEKHGIRQSLYVEMQCTCPTPPPLSLDIRREPTRSAAINLQPQPHVLVPVQWSELNGCGDDR